jgi:hypothetical protein
VVDVGVNAKILLLLAPMEGAEGWEQAVDAERSLVAGRLPEGAVARALVRVDDDPSPHLAARVEGLGVDSPSYDAILELESPTVSLAALIKAVDGVGGRLGGAVDASRSAAIAGSELVIVPGRAPFQFVYPMHHLTTKSPDEFRGYWLHEHLDVSRRNGNVGRIRFRQFHGWPPATAAASQAAGLGIDDLDGAAIGFYDEPEQFREVAVNPRFTMNDEANFVDQTRSTMGLYRFLDDDDGAEAP